MRQVFSYFLHHIPCRLPPVPFQRCEAAVVPRLGRLAEKASRKFTISLMISDTGAAFAVI